MLHGDDQALGANGDVHGAADAARAARSGNAPVGEIALLRNLQAAEDADIEMAAAGHHVRVHLREKCRAGLERHRDFHRVHEIEILFAGRARGPMPRMPFSLWK